MIDTEVKYQLALPSDKKGRSPERTSRPRLSQSTEIRSTSSSLTLSRRQRIAASSTSSLSPDLSAWRNCLIAFFCCSTLILSKMVSALQQLQQWPVAAIQRWLFEDSSCPLTRLDVLTKVLSCFVIFSRVRDVPLMLSRAFRTCWIRQAPRMTEVVPSTSASSSILGSAGYYIRVRYVSRKYHIFL
jgi:hypothetical protein